MRQLKQTVNRKNGNRRGRLMGLTITEMRLRADAYNSVSPRVAVSFLFERGLVSQCTFTQ